MVEHVKTPRKSLNKAYLKQRVLRQDIERFKQELLNLLNASQAGITEAGAENLFRDFLQNTYYRGKHYINKYQNMDMVIHEGNNPNDTVHVIIEAKAPSAGNEMISRNNINAKALQQLIYYYLKERINNTNIHLKHLIVTNVNEWFVFDAVDFEQLVYGNRTLKNQFAQFDIETHSTSFFYENIAKAHIDLIKDKLSYTYFDLRDYKAAAENQNDKDDQKLIALYKLLSPEHLLKRPFANDSNQLDKPFYLELLHIIGLEEDKEKGKKIIQRKKNPDSGSIIENTINILEYEISPGKLIKYGSTHDERKYNVALELCITWINRVLFLKLLESQLVSYHRGNRKYRFLKYSDINNYDALNKLFFQVLAVVPEKRRTDLAEKYKVIPYLNSSLFEPSEIESSTIRVSNLDDEPMMEVYGRTVLKGKDGKRYEGKIRALEYIFRFLDSYDFSSEGSEDIQEENKTLINASVLGLIFEKINGYKDGSFFTPGFITMYMCHETLEKAVMQKFSEVKGWKCSKVDELKDKIEPNREGRIEANEIINSIKICDPAVGSGHFLVSMLNEIIALKSKLGVLTYRDGNRVRLYRAEVVNDELMIIDEESDQIFEYKVAESGAAIRELQDIQEMLFHEKETIIEKCLFGVDINPNSVKICRLRLWIELLKNAYYTSESGYIQLETLPNIDINIKCGNSLVSRFVLNEDLKSALRKSKYNITTYRTAVQSYRDATDKEQKTEFKELINVIKNDFRSEVQSKDLKDLQRWEGEYYQRFGENTLLEVELSAAEKKVKAKESKKLLDRIDAKKVEIEEIQNNIIYENALEWRFEFPEVLDDSGSYLGFDMVIGNPPYMRVQEIQASQPTQKLYYESQYENAKAAYDLANIFFELAVNISSNKSNNAYIFPHKFFNAASSEVFRNYLKQGQYIDEVAHFGANMVFEDADTYTCVAQFSKKPSQGFYFQRFPFKSDFKNLMLDKSKFTFITYEMIDRAASLYGSNQWVLFDDEIGFKVFEKIYKQAASISTKFARVSQGIATGKDEIYVFEGIVEGEYIKGNFVKDKGHRLIEIGIMKPFLKGKDVQKYSTPEQTLFILFPYNTSNSGKASIMSELEIKNKFPNAYQWIKKTEDIHRKKDNKSTNDEFWYRYARNQGVDYIEMPKLSSMEICANHPNVIFNQDNFYHPTTVYSWVKKEETRESYEYLLAIANSKLLWWFLKITGDTLQGDARRFKTNYLNPFPIPEIISEEKEIAISSKVKEVLSHKKEDASADTSELEKQIDLLVYKLYELTEEEIDIVEKAVGQ